MVEVNTSTNVQQTPANTPRNNIVNNDRAAAGSDTETVNLSAEAQKALQSGTGVVREQTAATPAVQDDVLRAVADENRRAAESTQVFANDDAVSVELSAEALSAIQSSQPVVSDVAEESAGDTETLQDRAAATRDAATEAFSNTVDVTV